LQLAMRTDCSGLIFISSDSSDENSALPPNPE
jgi:hypothetical protein